MLLSFFFCRKGFWTTGLGTTLPTLQSWLAQWMAFHDVPIPFCQPHVFWHPLLTLGSGHTETSALTQVCHATSNLHAFAPVSPLPEIASPPPPIYMSSEHLVVPHLWSLPWISLVELTISSSMTLPCSATLTYFRTLYIFPATTLWTPEGERTCLFFSVFPVPGT